MFFRNIVIRVRKFLAYFFGKLKYIFLFRNWKNCHNEYLVYIEGYGDQKLAHNIELVSPDKLISKKFKRKVIFGIRYHSLQELNMYNNDSSYSQPKYTFVKQVRRILSLGLSSGRLFSGLLDGFVMEFRFSRMDKSSPPILRLPNGSLWISRNVGRTGIPLPNYSPTLEYDIRRRLVDADVYILDSRIIPRSTRRVYDFFCRKNFTSVVDYASNRDEWPFIKKIVDILPEWHLAKTFLYLQTSKSEIILPENIFIKTKLTHSDESTKDKFKLEPEEANSFLNIEDQAGNVSQILSRCTARDARIHHGQTITVGSYAITTDTSNQLGEKPSAFWPYFHWSGRNREIVAVPNVSTDRYYFESASYIKLNTNWAHFIEDVLPNFTTLLLNSHAELMLISEDISEIQKETLEAFSDSELKTLEINQVSEIRELVFTLHENRRGEAIEGKLTANKYLLDPTIMSRIANNIAPLSDIHERLSLNNQHYYIKRANGLFRRLSNKKEVEKTLEKYGFITLEAEKMSLKDRQKIFRDACALVAESGAGMANIIFCRNLEWIAEITPESLFRSQERDAIVQNNNLRVSRFLTRSSGFIRRFLYGSDQHRVDTNQLKTWLDSHFCEVHDIGRQIEN